MSLARGTSKSAEGMHRAVSRFASYWPLAVASAARDAFTHTCDHLVTYCTNENEGICMMGQTLGRNSISGINCVTCLDIRAPWFPVLFSPGSAYFENSPGDQLLTKLTYENYTNLIIHTLIEELNLQTIDSNRWIISSMKKMLKYWK